MQSLYGHEIIPNHGWGSSQTTKSVKKYEVHYEYDRYKQVMTNIPEELIKRDLAYKLGIAIIENNLAEFEKIFHPENFKETISASINIADPGIKFANLEQKYFKVQDEKFSNDELVEAVKHYYAERLI